MSDERACTSKDCKNPARCGIKTARPTRGNMLTTIYYDERTAPKAALPYCKPCGIEIMTQLASTLIDNG